MKTYTISGFKYSVHYQSTLVPITPHPEAVEPIIKSIDDYLMWRTVQMLWGRTLQDLRTMHPPD